MAAKHMAGALQIVKMAGGFGALGLSEFVRYMFYSCIYGKGLMDWDPTLHISEENVISKDS